jgi:predicted transposase/invertase (TIGR01784 family)
MISDAHKEGLAEGEAKGKAEGKAEGRTEDARNLKRLGVATDIIVQATGLTKDEVESL